jgi:hypothetical protein
MPRASVATAKAIDSSLMDELFEWYLDWKEACEEVWEAYARWREAVSVDRSAAFAAYLAALEEEEDASGRYAELMSAATRQRLPA